MEIFSLLTDTIILRPYVFLFLAAFLWAGTRLIGWPRTWRFLLINLTTAYICEFASTRIGIPFGWYHYNGSTVGQELYLSNIPLMASVSFSYLLYSAYCVALCLLLPTVRSSGSSICTFSSFGLAERTSQPVLLLTALLFAGLDVVIDPLALRGDRWFLGKIYYYPEVGLHFGVPLSNYAGWMVVGLISLSIYFYLDRRLTPLHIDNHTTHTTTNRILWGVVLYYIILLFNLSITFWIGETVLGITGFVMFLLPTGLLFLRLTGRAVFSSDSDRSPSQNSGW